MITILTRQYEIIERYNEGRLEEIDLCFTKVLM